MWHLFAVGWMDGDSSLREVGGQIVAAPCGEVDTDGGSSLLGGVGHEGDSSLLGGGT